MRKPSPHIKCHTEPHSPKQSEHSAKAYGKTTHKPSGTTQNDLFFTQTTPLTLQKSINGHKTTPIVHNFS